MTLLLCAIAQLLAAASKVCADFHETRRSSRNAGVSARPAARPRSWSRRCRWPRLTLLGHAGQLQLAHATRVDDFVALTPSVFGSPLPAPDEVEQPAIAGPTRTASARRAGGHGGFEFPERRAIVANSFLVVGGSALSAGLIAAGLAYGYGTTGQKDPMSRGDNARANADLQRVQLTGTVATSLLGAGGAVFLSGLALKLWNRSARPADTSFQGKLLAKPSKNGAIVALRATWGVAL